MLFGFISLYISPTLNYNSDKTQTRQQLSDDQLRKNVHILHFYVQGVSINTLNLYTCYILTNEL